MISRQSLQFMRFPGRAWEPESFTALPERAQTIVRTSINANNVQVLWTERVNATNVILKEPQRLKDLPVTYHDERAETSEFKALCEFYRRCVSYSLVDSLVAEAPSE